MKIWRFPPLLGLLISLLQGCGVDDGTSSNTPPRILPLPLITMNQGGRYSGLDLDEYVEDDQDPDASLLISVEGEEGVMVDLDDDHILSVESSEDTGGIFEPEITVLDTGGMSSRALLKVVVHKLRSCYTTFRYDGRGEGDLSIYIAGEFNSWSTTSTPLEDRDGDGIYEADLLLEKGYHAYKFVRNGEWILDPENPRQAYIDDILNSEVKVPDLSLPLISTLYRKTDFEAGSMEVGLEITDGCHGAGIDEASLEVEMNNEPVTDFTFDSEKRWLHFKVDGLYAGKYSFRARVSDNEGRGSEEAYIPVWLEEEDFSWEDGIIYFAIIDRFSNSDPSNDGEVEGVDWKANYQGGDYEGLKEKIEEGYFDSLPVSAIWITPVNENTNNAELGEDGRYYSAYHGYFPVSPDDVEEHHGTAESLRGLVDAAHSRGIRVIFDLIANHVHEDHPYYTEHSGDGWFHDYYLCGYDEKPIECWFRPYLPDLDYTNRDALHTLLDEALYWVREFDIDGFRVDAVKHILPVFIQDLRAIIEEEVENPENPFYMVGETFVGSWDDGGGEIIKEYVGEELLHGQFDFPLYWEIVKVFARDEADFVDLERVMEEEDGFYGDDALMGIFLGNHDVARFISHANGDISDLWGNDAKEQGWTNPPSPPDSPEPFDRMKLAFTFLMTVKGVPLIYYGDEFGMEGAGDPDNRRFMRFGDELTAFQEDLLGHVRKVVSLRRVHPSLRRGEQGSLYVDSTLFAFYRKYGSEAALIILNRGGEERELILDLSPLGITDLTIFSDKISGATATVSGSSLQVSVGGMEGAVYIND